MTDSTAPRVLIEDWLPVTELGIESRRERAYAEQVGGVEMLDRIAR